MEELQRRLVVEEEDQVYMTLSKRMTLERKTWRGHFVKSNYSR